MAFVIKKGEPQYTDTCNHCLSLIGFFDEDVITKPSRTFPASMMAKYIKCPECNNMFSVGNCAKDYKDGGNYKFRTTEEDWKFKPVVRET